MAEGVGVYKPKTLKSFLLLTIGSPLPQVFEAIAAVALVVDCGVKLSANQFFKGALDQKSKNLNSCTHNTHNKPDL